MTDDDRSGLDVAAELADVPDGAVATDAVVVVSYMLTDGQPMIAVGTFGDSLVHARLGMLAWASHTVWEHNEDVE